MISARNRMIRIALCVLILAAAGGLVLAQAPKAPSGETVHGTLTARGDLWVEIRIEGEKTSQRYAFPAGTKLDAKADAFMKGLVVGSEMQIILGANHMMSSLSVLGLPGASGLVTGTVTDVSTAATWYLEVRDDQGRTDRYWPAYRGGPGYGPMGGFDKDMSAAFKERNVGDRVEIRRSADDHIRVTSMRLLALADHPALLPGGEAATVVGVVAEKGKDWISIKGDDGAKERYSPQRVIGGAADEVDRDILHAIGVIAVGKRVEARWFRDGDTRRLYSLKSPPPAPAPDAKSPAAPPTAAK